MKTFCYLLIEALINKKTSQSIADMVSDRLINKEDSAAISKFASELSTISKKLEATGDKKAIDGLRQVAKQFASDQAGFEDFMKSVDKLDKADYKAVFSTIDKMADKGLKVDKWMDTFSSISDEEPKKELLEVTNQILKDDKAGAIVQKETLNKLITSINEIQNGDAKDKDDKIEDLLNIASQSKSLPEMKAAIDQYNKSISIK